MEPDLRGVKSAEFLAGKGLQHNLPSSVLFPFHPFKMDVVEYSIGVNNRFGALNLDEEDPEEFLQKQEKKEESAKKDKAKKQDKKAVKQPAKDTKSATNKTDIVNEESKREGLSKIICSRNIECTSCTVTPSPCHIHM